MAEYVVNYYEKNFAYDSYFYAVVYNTETREVRDIEYGATAYASNSRDLPSDAPKDIMAEYRRVIQARQNWERRAYFIGIAKECHLDNYHEAKKLCSGCRGKRLDAVKALLKVKTFKSAFRKSLAEQVRAWIKTPDELLRFPTPLSERQFAMITRY